MVSVSTVFFGKKKCVNGGESVVTCKSALKCPNGQRQLPGIDCLVVTYILRTVAQVTLIIAERLIVFYLHGPLRPKRVSCQVEMAMAL